MCRSVGQKTQGLGRSEQQEKQSLERMDRMNE